MVCFSIIDQSCSIALEIEIVRFNTESSRRTLAGAVANGLLKFRWDVDSLEDTATTRSSRQS